MRETIKARVMRVGASLRDFGDRAAPVLQKGLRYGLAAATAAATVAKVAHEIHGAVRGEGPRHATAPASPDFMYQGRSYGDALASYDPVAARGGSPAAGGWAMGSDGRWRRNRG